MSVSIPNSPFDAVIMVAAGRGSRAGAGLPKQYRAIAGTPVIRHTIDAIRRGLPDALIIPVIHPDDIDLFNDCIVGIDRVVSPVWGGNSRQQSVLNALLSLEDSAVERVYIHDAARPFITSVLLENIKTALDNGYEAVVPALPVVDTLVKIHAETATETVDRTGLYAVQTPQVFAYASIVEAHKQATDGSFTDDASIFQAFIGPVHYCDGVQENFKITTQADFDKAEHMLKASLSDIRTGTGFDVHRFDDGDHVWLCGVKIPFNKSLKGHSDADVALHALTDALLASIADGDIGTHFPPTDDKWRGVASDQFLCFAAQRVRERGGMIANLAVTIICERPKIGPHMQTMRQRIADIAGIDNSRVSVQATTTEQLGFTGRGEGIAAQALATVRLPEGNF